MPVAPSEASVADAVSVKRAKAPKKTKIKIFIIAGVALICVIAGTLFAFGQYQKNQETSTYNKYVSTLEEVSSQMLGGAVVSENLGNTTLDVWKSAIWDHDVNKWDADIQPYYSEDFNESLRMLYAASSTQQQVKLLKDGKSEVDASIKSMQNPPKGCEKAYSALLDLYDAYSTMVNMAAAPTGSYQSFSSSFTQADKEFSTKYDRMKTQTPSTK